MLKDKKILFGICGGIAAYKIVSVISNLARQGCKVTVIMTESATRLVSPNTFRAVSGSPVITGLFAPSEDAVLHVGLADEYDLMVIAPATANVLAKAAHGIADDILTTTLVAFYKPVLFVPAMNTRMWDNPIVQANVNILKNYKYNVLEPAVGHLACGASGAGRLPDENSILEAIIQQVSGQDLKGRNVLITSGGTREYIDKVRFISNASSGKMGAALVLECLRRGAEVVHVAAVGDKSTDFSAYNAGGSVNTVVSSSSGNLITVSVESADEMFSMVSEHFPTCDVFISAAAVADFKPLKMVNAKIKKGDLTDGCLELKLVPNPDILKSVASEKQPGQIVVGFSLESEDLETNSLIKLKSKNLDLIVANSPAAIGADESEIVIFDTNCEKSVYQADKETLSTIIVDHIAALL